ncbi:MULTISPECIES: periplasmic heavy metal sensor [unclassified Blastomonas]|uniref:periplasmic heavy metal sensor n=1 Tax=unclassified Blastomonas TaxID=2626550 RepID=UPI0008243479|nr:MULTISPECIES: periplasmic heavy metal sensor [unclassified Blastomonas]
MKRPMWLALVAVVAFAAALAGNYLGQRLLNHGGQKETELHAFLHGDLDLNDAQTAKIEAIEQRFAARRRVLEREMKKANAHLAEAMAAEHGYGPEVTKAVDHTHHVMGEMQKETLEHLFEMRSVLRPDQAAAFDRAVTKALAPDPK